MFRVRQTAIPGCKEIYSPVFKDHRGYFIKTLHHEEFSKIGLERIFTEEYVTISNQNVLRGLHFQVPPRDHWKLVYCVQGNVMDAVVDLRKGSPTFGKHEVFHLEPEKGNMVYMPPGVAHGFYVTGNRAVMVYKVTTTYSPEYDKGILWNSAGIPWPDLSPIISDRDASFPSLPEFTSPFSYSP